jgi:hypothetical protein
VRRPRADTLTDIGSRGGRSRHLLLEAGAEGEGNFKRARFKAWLRRTFLPERSPRSPVRKVEEPLSSLTTLLERDGNAAVPTIPLHRSYRMLETVGHVSTGVSSTSIARALIILLIQDEHERLPQTVEEVMDLGPQPPPPPTLTQVPTPADSKASRSRGHNNH